MKTFPDRPYVHINVNLHLFLVKILAVSHPILSSNFRSITYASSLFLHFLSVSPPRFFFVCLYGAFNQFDEKDEVAYGGTINVDQLHERQDPLPFPLAEKSRAVLRQTGPDGSRFSAVSITDDAQEIRDTRSGHLRDTSLMPG